MSKLIDLTGQKINHWTVLERAENNARGGARWKCQCDCKNQTIKTINSYSLISGSSKSCGCEQKKNVSKLNFIDITNKQYGHLTVLEYIGTDKSRKTLWKCQCNCKAQTIIITRGTDLRSGKTTSCGCVKSKGELIIAQLLMENNIPFEKEKTFLNCIFPDTKGLARFDFYINNKYLIEFDGEQHYDITNPWYSEINKKHDEFKTKWCIENNIPLIRISYNQLNTLTIKDLLYE